MFEGIVQKLLLEYLGRYVKDIQKEQLKIGLWNGEVLLEKVELILEAFDYLQLPFALKQGRVGRLSIKIPWKKLGWDPIIIYLEDVFICACQREDHEWSLDPIEKREYAWKKAKLAAAELAKLSRRVCDNQAGQSFTSYITAKILDGIQVSIKNVHVKCINGEADSEKFVFGLRLSSLTMKQNPIWSSSSKIRGGQVNKVVEISELGIYCRKSEEAAHWAIADYVEPLLLSNAEAISDKNDYILAPFDVALSLVVNRSGKVENGVPQYSIFAELTALVLLLNEVQIQQILILWDYLSIYQLREKYGRFRPCHNSLLKKLNGWQRMWWQYAQKSVLSDVRRRLRKTSWSYLCWRMSHCRKYVNLYKKKLGFLRQEQPVDKSILLELEQMEKESDIEDILSYRSIAECESQELLFNFTSSNVGKNDGSITSEKQQNDEGSSVKSRGWLNWLSLGMLGAGGTEDSIQFSGVVSDEVIKDIYEVTEFHPASLVDGSTSTKCRIYSSIKFNVHRTVATLFSKMHGKEAVKMISDEVIIECKHSEESCTFTFLVNSLEVSDPCSNNIVLFTRQSSVAESTLENQPSIIAQLDMFVVKCDTELSVKVLFQPIEVVYDSSFLLNLYYFLHVLGSYKFHHERVVLSLNGFENVKARISSKAEYTLSHRVKIFWDVTFSTILVQIPWRCPELRLFMMKPGRHLFLAIHAEGAIKVLSIIDSSHHLMKDIKETSFAGFKEKKNLDQKKDTLVEFTERLSVHFSFIGISLINSIPQELLFVSAKDTKIDILQNMEQQKLFFHLSSLQIDNQLTNATYPVILSFDHDYGSDSARGDSLNFKSGKMAHISSPISCEPRFSLAAAKWRNKEISLVSFEYISLRLAPLQLELEEEVILCLLDFFKTIMSRLKRTKMPCPGREFHHPVHENCSSPLLPSAIPIGAPWQQIYLLARRQKKIYVEVLDLSPIKLTLSFSSAPWMPRNEGPTYAESLGYRGLMALADVEGAPVHLRQLVIDHHMGSWESFQDILIRHYTWQLLHETYKIFGSAGVMGNPMGFARNLGLGIKDFLSVPARGIFQSPSGLITGMAQGTSSLVSNTVYAVSNAATQFSKSAHKSIVAFTFDDQMVSRMEKQQKGSTSQSKGVLHEFLEGLTGFLQSPVRGAEKHGLAGVVSGIALGTAGLVARPVASILEVTGKTAQSIRNRSSLHRPHHFRVRFPRPLSKEFPLRPYSWEEAIGTSMLLEVSDAQLKDEKFVKCKTLQKAGSFVIITKRLILVVTCPNLVGLGTSEFRGVAADPQWLIEVEMGLDRVIHLDREKQVLNIVGSKLESLLKQHQQRKGTPMTKWDSTSLPLFQMNVEFRNEEEAEEVLQVILSTIENIKERGLDVHTLHQSDVRQKKSMLHYYPSSFHVP